MASVFGLDVVGWVNASTVFAFGNVNLFFSAAGNFDVDLSIRVAAVVVSVSMVAGSHKIVRVNSTRAADG